MRVQVEWLHSHNADVYDVGRIPCVGESVSPIGCDECFEVRSVIHILNADPVTQVLAIVRVKGEKPAGGDYE